MEKPILKKDLLADLTTLKKTDESFMDKLINESSFMNLLPEIAKEKLKDFFIALYKISLKELIGLFEPFQFLEMLFDLLQIINNNKSLPRPIAIREFCQDKKLNSQQKIILLNYLNGVLSSAKEVNFENLRFYKIFIEAELKSLIDESPAKQSSNVKTPQHVIALKYVYLKIAGEHEGINESNSDGIAKLNGWISKNSGKKIFEIYKNYHLYPSERIQPPVADREDQQFERSKKLHLNKLQKVIDELISNPKAQSIAQQELEKAQKK